MLFRHAAIFALLLVSLTQGSAWAAGNVLLPPDNGMGGAPNLGLVPAEQEPAPPAPAAPTQLPVLPPVAPPVSAAPPPAQAQTPSSGISRLKIVWVNPAWMPNDIVNVSRQLGIPPNFVANQCRLGLDGTLTSDHNSFPFNSNLIPGAIVTYTGAILNVTLNVYASCVPAQRPGVFTYLQQLGNKNSVYLGTTFCAPQAGSPTAPHQLSFVHTGNGNDMCTYQ
jgi:hypothetical protein